MNGGIRMSIAFYKDQFIPVNQAVIPIDERGHQFGDGVYEVIRVYNGKPFLLEEHLLRLESSAKAIQLQLTHTLPELTTIILEGIKLAHLDDAEVYVDVTRGIAPRAHLFPDVPSVLAMTVRPTRIIPDHLRKTGVKITLLPDERWTNCYIKSLNLLPNLLAKQRAFSTGYYEAVFYKEGLITEGSSSNVFIANQGKLYSPPLSKKILPGITRAKVLELADRMSLTFQEAELSIQDLHGADEVFITSTTYEIMPVVQIDDQTIGTGLPGPVTVSIKEAYENEIKQVTNKSLA
jgi:D-alanine transaminase